MSPSVLRISSGAYPSPASASRTSDSGPDASMTASAASNRGFSSSRSFWADRLPMPGTSVRAATSSVTTAMRSCSYPRVARIDMATFGPTPETPSNTPNTSLSADDSNPYRAS